MSLRRHDSPSHTASDAWGGPALGRGHDGPSHAARALPRGEARPDAWDGPALGWAELIPLTTKLRMDTLVVAALSARLLAEAAARDGFRVIALDLFGDADTRRVCVHWHGAGDAAAMHMDPPRLLEGLRAAAAQAGGWIAGSGFDADFDLLAQGAAILPMLGMPLRRLRNLRDPSSFFAALAQLGVPHPLVAFRPPRDCTGWLRKDAGGSGGWRVRRARTQEPPLLPSQYFQCEEPGEPVSATIVAAHHGALVLGFNRMLVESIGSHPYVYAGAIGPITLPPAAEDRARDIVATLAAHFALMGLCSVDMLLQGSRLLVLEVNARPPATIALYPDRTEPGLVRSHLDALDGRLPTLQPPLPHNAAQEVRGVLTVFAPSAATLGAATAQRWAGMTGCHDVPAAGARFASHDPVCTVSACGRSAPEVETALRRLATQRIAELEPLMPEGS
jgi:uncharacterized protein